MTSHTKDKSAYYIGRYYVHGTELGTETTKSSAKKLVRTRTGIGMPNWKQKIADRQNATTSMTGVYDSATVEGWINDRLTYYWDPVNGWGGNKQEETIRGNVALYEIVPVISSDPSLDNNVDGRASNKYLSAARQLTTHMDGITFVGELKQTLRMLRHPAEALSRSIEAYLNALSKRKRDEMRRRRRKGLPQLPKDSPKWEWYHAIPDLWLEYSFGWQPLMMDIEDAWDALTSLSESEGVVHLSRSAQGSKLRSQSFTSGNLYAGALRLRRDSSIQAKTQTTIRYRGDVLARAATTFNEKEARWGFTASQFIPSVWELLPWSFLVDYFAKIGDFLDASFTRTADLKWTCRTIRRKYVTNCLIQPARSATLSLLPAAGRAEWLSDGPCLCKFVRVEVDRTASASPVPAVVFVDFHDQSSQHLANMSALFGSACANLHSQNPSPRNYRR